MGIPFDIPALAIVGPTASGKSALGVWLAQQGLPIEIISLDSALVFRDMDIGTAKPSPQELASVPHHLIDIISPEETFSAADFLTACHGLIADIRQRGRVPVILGGTLMYYNAMVAGLDDLPKADAIIRARIEADANQLGWPHVHAELSKVDPVTAARLKPNDSQRLQRAMEVYLLTGQPLSTFHKRDQAQRLSLPTLALEPGDRSVLHARIAERFVHMLESGLIDEVVSLRQRYVLDTAMPSMRCVGYRQVWAYLDGELNRAEMIEKGVAATRQLAKRQITWLRSMPGKHTVDPLQANWLELAKPWLSNTVDALLQFK
ncbi:tRNA (adenosine(37)-N6)-dimethylallyltransferase MiaA [Limnobacter humi]|uniref:tRNA dimethylallyltransferase n=1 Tax=Limnobacter humi TaxID=1778671 RepID=A0ABT1WBI2_9BURK|nr:tRNA (adenosine(37)-N6)-dimethylallyltransferase MiaA [Limnobacter humi]MCQ8894870.1 tRNA (adenosine(37)-N6)-dimethylallyltransferase MiaA [Limnobacter humi]